MPQPESSSSPPSEADAPNERHTRVGRFVQAYSGFLSSFVIGFAGLCATSIYQCNQVKLANRQAESQRQLAQTQADNNWKIERAKILSDNLQVLTRRGDDTTGQRYGVLLSLTRGELIDPELAVSYALDLGRENPDYMRNVLGSIQDKDYQRLANAFQISCEQHFGLARAVPLCQGDSLAGRSAVLSEIISDDTDAALTADKIGPMAILRSEREVQGTLLRDVLLFTPLVTDLYDQSREGELAKFSGYSAGSRLVSALVILGIRNEERAARSAGAQAEQELAREQAWLTSYLGGTGCDPECRAKIASMLVTGLGGRQGKDDDVLRGLLLLPHEQAGVALARLHNRLLWCQVVPEDAAALRDRVVVPALSAELGRPKARPATVDDLLGLLALLPDPTDEAAKGAYEAVLARLQNPAGNGYHKAFLEHRAAALRLQKNPPPSKRGLSFCNAAEEIDNKDAANPQGE